MSRTLSATAEETPVPPSSTGGPTASDLAWLSLVPTVAVLLPAIVWLAPPLARAVLSKPGWHVFPSVAHLIIPEPEEQVRYVLALLTPLLLGGFFLLARRWSAGRGWTRGRLHVAAVGTVQLSVLAAAASCWVAQADHRPWFSTVNLALAVAFALVVLTVVRRRGLIAAPSARRWSVVAFGAAGALTAAWLLPSIFDDTSIVRAAGFLRYHLQFTMNELLTVANERAPLVDYASQYTKLLPYLFAPIVAVAGPSVLTVTTTLGILSMAAMLAVYLTFRAVTGNAVAALVLYVPFLAVTNYMLVTIGNERVYLANIYGVVPLRVLGPFVVAWLLTVELRRPRSVQRVALFVVAGLVAVNNLEYGLACLGGLLAGLWCGGVAGRRWTWRRAGRLLAEAAAGGALAATAACVLTLATTGSLPQPAFIGHFNRIFAVEGFGLIPMRPFGLHVVFFLTFCAALVVATIASATGSALATRSPVLVGALAYSGVLGLGAYSYWVGRSHPDALFGVFPTWGFTVALLAWLVVSEVAGRPAPRAFDWTLAVPAVLVLTSFGIMATVIPQLPSPLGQLRRMTMGSAPARDAPPSSFGCATSPRIVNPCLVEPESFRHAAAVRFVEDHTDGGERVMVLTGLGHLIARESGVVNVSPYSHQDSIAFVEQMDFLLDAFDREGATSIFLSVSYPEIPGVLQERGFVAGAFDPASELTEWVRGRTSEDAT